MNLQELTSKAGVNVKQMSKTTTVYPDYYFSFFSLSCFPLYRYAARPITEPYRTAKNRYISVYRYIDTALIVSHHCLRRLRSKKLSLTIRLKYNC